MKRLTLNNDIQDRSHTHQCMAYQLFRDAGAIAPRCNFAHVTVNGDDLGIYSNVESIKKPFLACHFQDNDGNLYKGQGSDFHPNMVASFQLKTNERENDRSDLDRVVKAMDVDDEQLFKSLEEVIDMDAFLTHWAMEAITGHWDSYTGNHAFETWGAVVKAYSNDDTTDYTVLGFIGDGKIVFEEVGTNDGDPVRGSFEGIFVPQRSSNETDPSD